MRASAAMRPWLRYVVPLTMLSAVALVPIGWIALRTGIAADAAQGRAQLAIGWLAAASAWLGQLVLVAGVAPAIRDPALSQWRAFTRGARSLVRAIVPCLVAAIAIAIGGLALALPGLALLALLALTGASDHLGEPLPAPLVDSVAVARASLLRVAVIVGLMLAIDLAIAAGWQAYLIPAFPKKPPPATLHACRTFVRAVAISLVAISPLPACALAATYARARSFRA